MDDQTTGFIENEPAPTGTLHGGSSGIELLFHFLTGTKVTVDGLCERTRFKNATNTAILSRARSEILPKERMIDVTFSWESDNRYYISKR